MTETIFSGSEAIEQAIESVSPEEHILVAFQRGFEEVWRNLPPALQESLLAGEEVKISALSWMLTLMVGPQYLQQFLEQERQTAGEAAE